jgi:hypothetical protein
VLTPSGAPRLAAAMTPYLRRRAAHPTEIPTSETPNGRVDAS